MRRFFLALLCVLSFPAGVALAGFAGRWHPFTADESLTFQNGLYPTPDYDGIVDTYIQASLPTSNFSGDTLLWLSESSERILMDWDISAIPTDSTTITHAELTLLLFAEDANPADQDMLIRLDRPMVIWTPGGATWQNRTVDSLWVTSGANDSVASRQLFGDVGTANIWQRWNTLSSNWSSRSTSGGVPLSFGLDSLYSGYESGTADIDVALLGMRSLDPDYVDASMTDTPRFVTVDVTDLVAMHFNGAWAKFGASITDYFSENTIKFKSSDSVVPEHRPRLQVWYHRSVAASEGLVGGANGNLVGGAIGTRP